MPPRKDQISNQDNSSLLIEKDQIISPYLPNFSHVFKLLRNEAADDHHESTDISRTGRYDSSRTDKD